MSDPTSVLVVGDTHGSMRWLCGDVIPYATKLGVTQIVQVGDFGFIWDGSWSRTLRKLDRVLDTAGIDLLFLPGNHENHDLLAHLAKTSRVNADGHHQLTKHIAYTGRVSTWTWSGRRLSAVGGAVSIDRDWRIQRELRTGTPQWWPAEVLTNDEHEQALALGPVDVLFTHDGPTAFPAEGLKADLDSTANRQRITDTARALRPKLLFHGHYHRSLTYPLPHEDGVCEVRCLDCDDSPRTKGCALLTLAESVPPTVPDAAEAMP